MNRGGTNRAPLHEPLFFGARERRLFGLLHSQPGPQRRAMVLCAPLLQEGIRSHRALWVLAESAADSGVASLCFDWYGTGDSAGEDTALSLAGMLADLDQARQTLALRAGTDRIEWLALRSAALPLLVHLAAKSQPVEVVLWDPQLSGTALVESWYEQHRAQIYGNGRYPHARHEPEPDELLGFAVDASLLGALRALDATRLQLPRGSQVRLLLWQADDDIVRFSHSQRMHGVTVETVLLEDLDRPGWEEPTQFGSQAYPRRSVARISQQWESAR
jgi:uncharacterized protein